MDKRVVLFLPAALLLGGCASSGALPLLVYDVGAGRSSPAPIAASVAGFTEGEITEIDMRDFDYATVCGSAKPTGSRIAREPECHVADREEPDSADRQFVRERIEHVRREQLSPEASSVIP